MATGSWGLPEFGLTERLANFFGQGRTAQGGSNLFGDQAQTTLVPSSGSTPNFVPSGTSGAYGINSYVIPNTTNTVTNGGSSSGVSNNTSSSTNNNGASNNQQSYDPYAAIRSDIGSKWDNYINSLSGQDQYLNDQKTSQENIANTQYAAGQDTVNTQKASSLRDIATNVRNAFVAGNNYLGARGAGDSSAANMYSFAVQQDANKQVGRLNEFTNTQINNLAAQRDTQINSIANWFSQAQQQLKQQIAQGYFNKQQDIDQLSKSILDQSISAMNQVKQNAQSQYNSLVTWAANNSTNLSQLQSNIAGIPQAMGNPTIDSTGNFSQLPIGAGNYNSQTLDWGRFPHDGKTW